MRLVKAVCGAALMSMAASGDTAAGYQTNVNTVIARAGQTIIGQSIAVPKDPVVIFSTSTFAPGARTKEHTHPWPHYVCIQEGTLTIVGTEIGKTFDFHKGVCFVEMIGKRHYGINNGSVPVVTVVVDQVPSGVTSNSVPVHP